MAVLLGVGMAVELAPAACPVGWWHADHRARRLRSPCWIRSAGPRGCGTAIFGRPWRHGCAQADASKATTTPQLYGRRASCPGPDVGPVRGALFGPDPATSVVHQMISSSTSLAGDGPPVAVQQPPHPLRAQPGPPGHAEQPHRTTLKPHDRRAKRAQTGGTCQAAGCPPRPDRPLAPHHAIPWSHCHTTSISDTVLLCEKSHHDLHTGGRTLKLRDGRRLNASNRIHDPP